MSKRIEFRAWGQTKNVEIPTYAVVKDDGVDIPITAVCRAIARKTGGGVHCLACRHDSNTPDSRHYVATFGTTSLGGSTPIAEVWIAIPTETA